MYLSNAKEGQTVVITKVRGYGAFRRRINEMGFIKDREVNVVKNAPFKDPIEYNLMGYNVSLRRSEASLIEVTPLSEYIDKETESIKTIDSNNLKSNHTGRDGSKTINVALVGNPNCGKTSLFNSASGSKEHVGNYSGVTVDLKMATKSVGEYTINIIDLPGIYSMTTYTPEEQYTIDYIMNEKPDIIINVIDTSNIERNLYLTTQLIDMDLKVVGALNMFDELKSSNSKLNHKKLGMLTGIPFIPTSAIKGEGVDALFNKVIECFENIDPVMRHIHINYGDVVEASISSLRSIVEENRELTALTSPRHLAIRLLENDGETLKLVNKYPEGEHLIFESKLERERIERRLEDSSESLITDAKYGFIKGALKETFKKGRKERRIDSDDIDKIVTNKWLGYPIFLLIMYIIFYTTFEIGSYPMGWLESLMGAISNMFNSMLSEGILKDLIIDGMLNGVTSVIVFLPNIMILLFFMSLMEDSGYMARAAFIMDKIMHRVGLHGRSFIPLLMGVGCNIPAIMATRTIRNRGDRLLTMLLVPFISCSARLPVYILFAGTFFPGSATTVILSIYVIGILVAIFSAAILNKSVFKRKETPFVMELPPYRAPVLKSALRHMWDKGSSYLKKVGGPILAAVVLIWVLEYFPRTEDSYNASLEKGEITADYTPSEYQLENSYLGMIGKSIEPTVAPIGFDWKMSISLLTGFAAKEIVVGTMGVIYGVDNTPDGEPNEATLKQRLKDAKHEHGKLKGQPTFTPSVAFAFMLFVLIYSPCFGVLGAIKRESGSWKWVAFVVIYSTSLAWIVSFATAKIGALL